MRRERCYKEDQDIVGRTILDGIFERYVFMIKIVLILPMIESNGEFVTAAMNFRTPKN